MDLCINAFGHVFWVLMQFLLCLSTLSGNMNFILRTAQPVTSDLPSVPEAEHHKEARPTQNRATTLEGLIAEDRFPNFPIGEDDGKDNDGASAVGAEAQDSENQVAFGNHTDVTEDEGCIIIPNNWTVQSDSGSVKLKPEAVLYTATMELPDNWRDASGVLQLQLLDRSFIFPASKQDTEIITPFRVAAVMPKNSKSSQNGNQQNKILGIKSSSASEEGDASGTHEETAHHSLKDDGETISTGNEMTPRRVISATKSLLRMEDHKQQTENLLERCRNSNFFVRVTQSGEPLWCKRNVAEQSLANSDMAERTFQSIGGSLKTSTSLLNAVVDKGNFDGNTCGGLARDTIKCYSLCNGDIVFGHPIWSKDEVRENEREEERERRGEKRKEKGQWWPAVACRCYRRAVEPSDLHGPSRDNLSNLGNFLMVATWKAEVLLQVIVGISNIKDPVLEVLQFEKYQVSNYVYDNFNNSPVPNHEDPCNELLNWLLPLDRILSPPHPLSPPLSSSVYQKTYSSPGSQIFSFSHLRSYSMPSLPQVSGPPSSAIPPNSRPSFDLEDFDRFSPEKPIRSRDVRNMDILSFRGVSLEPERFSVHCGLEGIYLPGRRWSKKLEIIQPLEIRSFAAECITEDLICVQIKNVAPAHIPDIIIFLDAITIVFGEALKGGPSLSHPIASIETGNGHSLPNLVLRRGEEHSFILKPASMLNRDFRGNGETSSLQPHSKMSATMPNMHMISRISERGRAPSGADQYAILVSCRCNYTESRLFFKQLTDWQPRIARDLMITVASESYQQTVRPNAREPQLPVQVLTLKATNLTSEDLILTVLAPESSTSSPSILSLNSSPNTPMSPFIGFHEYMGRMGGDRCSISMHGQSLMPITTESQKVSDGGGIRSSSLEHRTGTVSDVISSDDSGCTHLWLQSAVPLGCVPAHSSATVKLELLPLTDGIITLDTLQIYVKEKGLTCIPEQSLKIYATSSIATGIL
ncbi:hypothetical protein COCNU_03G000680 [Cocos nucifera]|uniref:Uncharacterized protein n=1 Tax=Cocos nucifera TaxID=13894 RepID=A0A8K0I1T9_COCNU|nr:hypothetical protein COCNU_03G000680 [Cocos nucifera]